MNSSIRNSSERFIVGDDDKRLSELGSSAKITAGLLTSARATAMRCFSPPDSSLGLCEARSLKPIN